jgi:hypothetical protein
MVNVQHVKQWATQTQLKTIPSFIYSGRVSSSWSTNGTRRVFKNPMLSNVRRKNEMVISVKPQEKGSTLYILSTTQSMISGKLCYLLTNKPISRVPEISKWLIRTSNTMTKGKRTTRQTMSNTNPFLIYKAGREPTTYWWLAPPTHD